MNRSLAVEQNPSRIYHRGTEISRVLRAPAGGRRGAVAHGGQGVVCNPAQHDGRRDPPTMPGMHPPTVTLSLTM